MAGNSVDRQINVTAKGSNVVDEFKKINQSAKELSRDMIQDAQKYSQNSRDLIKNLNEQISAMERRNRLEKEHAELGARKDLASGGDKTAFSSRMSEISLESKEDKVQTDVLKDILSAVLQTSKDEIGENKEAVQENLARLQGIGTAKDTRDPEAVLKAAFQEQMLGGGGTSNVSAGGNAFVDAAGSLSETDFVSMGAKFGQQQATQAASRRYSEGSNKTAKFLTMAGISAGALAMSIRPGMEMFEGRADISRATGFSQERIEGSLGGLSDDLDVSETEMTKGFVSSLRAGGSGLFGRGNMRTAAQLQSGLGVDPSSVAGIMRGDRSGSSMRGVAGGMFKGMKSEGGDEAFFSEFIAIHSQLAERQIEVLGSIDTGINTEVITRLQGVSDMFNDPRILGNLVNSIDAGMRSPATPEAEAFQMMMIKRLNPTADNLELAKIRGQGITAMGGQVFEDMVGGVKAMGGSKFSQVKSLQTLFGEGVSLTLGEQILNGKFKSAAEVQSAMSGTQGMGLDARTITDEDTKATFTQNALRRQAATMTEVFGEAGIGVGKFVTEIEKAIKRVKVIPATGGATGGGSNKVITGPNTGTITF